MNFFKKKCEHVEETGKECQIKKLKAIRSTDSLQNKRTV